MKMGWEWLPVWHAHMSKVRRGKRRGGGSRVVVVVVVVVVVGNIFYIDEKYGKRII